MSAFAQDASVVRIIVDKSDFKLYVFRSDSLIRTYSAAIGKVEGDKQKVGDNRTPEGEFSITRIQDSRSWTHDFKDGKGPIAGAYGPWFLRLDTGADKTTSRLRVEAASARRRGKAWTGIGIHGTHDPNSIGTRVSEGCVRLRNDDIQELKHLVKAGTLVTIRE